MLQEFIIDEQEHYNWVRTHLCIIEQIGIENYLIEQLGEKVHLDSGTLTPLLKRLEKQGLVNRERPEYNENTLLISLTEAGAAMQDDALSVPEIMKNCTGLSMEECSVLRKLLDKALTHIA
jgi:DNA-binding MarR family transcriptional regulator